MNSFGDFKLVVGMLLLILALAVNVSNGRQSNRLWEEIDEYLAPNPLAFEYTESTQDCGLDLIKLPKRVVPSHYDIIIQPNPDSLSVIEGAVRVDVRVQDGDIEQVSDNQIVLHAAESIKIELVWYVDLGTTLEEEASNLGRRKQTAIEQLIDVKHVCRNQNNQQLLVVTLERNLAPGSRGQLYLTFASEPTNDDNSGSNGSNNNSLYWGASSLSVAAQGIAPEFKGQLHSAAEAKFARRAFPCFNEPEFRATFGFGIVHPASHVALSNSYPIEERYIEAHTDYDYDDAAGLVKVATQLKFVRFARTPPMAPHMLALVLDKFDCFERELNTPGGSQLKIRFCIKRGRASSSAELVQFTLDAASRALVSMQNYFGIEYPFKNLDLVASPDFDSAPLSSWGLIVANEEQLLIDDWYAGPETRAATLELVLRGIARQWLGNLVTLGDPADTEHYPNQLLNEALVRLVQFRLGQEIFPEFDFEYKYLLDTHIVALDADYYESPAAIAELAYKKATAAIHALQEIFLPEEKFKLALRHFLRKNHFQAALNLSHFCEAVGLFMQNENSTQSVNTKVCDEFLSSSVDNQQKGCLLIKVSYPYELQLEQERFSVVELDADASGRVFSGHRGNNLMIPIALTAFDSNNQCTITLSRLATSHFGGAKIELQKALDLPLSVLELTTGPNNWIKLNANFSGLYRVHYENDSMFVSMRGAVVAKSLLPPVDRLNLLDDTRALAMTNKVSAMRLLDTITWFKDENDGAVLCSLVEAFRSLMEIVEQDSALSNKLTSFGHKLFGNIYDKLGGVKTTETTYIGMRSKASVLNLLVDLSYEPAVNSSIKLFFETDAMPAFYLREPLYTAVVKFACDAYQGWLFAKIEATASREERARLAISLAKAIQSDRLVMIWRWLKQKNVPLDQDQKLRALRNIIGSKQGRQFVLELAREKGRGEVLGMQASKSMITLLLRNLLLAGEIRSRAEALETFPELFDGPEANDWPFDADALLKEFEKKSEVLRESAHQMSAALDHHLAR